jgi:hypothetical protein
MGAKKRSRLPAGTAPTTSAVPNQLCPPPEIRNPPVTSTPPSPSSVAVCSTRGAASEGPGMNDRLAGE